MSTEQDLDLINSLGLGASEPTEQPAVVEGTEPADEAEAATAPAKREAIKITGEIKTGLAALLPARAPSGGGFGKRGSKYPFEDLTAPAKNEAGEVTGYSFFEVRLTDVENADAKKLQSAIQAAVAAQNKQAKEAGEVTKYVSRTIVGEDGAYAGSSVYRVDDTINEDD